MENLGEGDAVAAEGRSSRVDGVGNLGLDLSHSIVSGGFGRREGRSHLSCETLGRRVTAVGKVVRDNVCKNSSSTLVPTPNDLQTHSGRWS